MVIKREAVGCETPAGRSMRLDADPERIPPLLLVIDSVNDSDVMDCIVVACL